MVCYVLADLLFIRMYIPNRYTRYSIPVLLALWYGANWSRALARVPWRPVRALALVVMLGVGAYHCRDTFEMGKDTSDREESRALNEFLATVPEKSLIAGWPTKMDDVPILARRSVLCNRKLAHPWYSEYYAEVRHRTEAVLDAIYATECDPIDRLVREWGVTHLVVHRKYMNRRRIRGGRMYLAPYSDYVARIAGSTRHFLLSNPPRQNVVYRDGTCYVLQLPLASDDGHSPPERSDAVAPRQTSQRRPK
jgi:hypothetical protein